MRNDQSTFIAELGYIIDQFDELQDLRWSDLQYLAEYRELRMKNNDGLPIDQNRLDELEPRFKNKIVTAARWNKFQNALVGMQTFIKNEVEGFVLDKQQEITDYTDLKKQEVEAVVTNAQNTINSTKDAALISIENKKDNVIEYLDGTTAGALRNDVGDMSQSTIEGRSLIDKTNNLKQDLITHKNNSVAHGTATKAEAQVGTSHASYMTPLRVKEAIQALQAVTSVAGRTGAVALTKSDVGLDSVQNYGIASEAEAIAGVNNKYVTPLRMKQAIDNALQIRKAEILRTSTGNNDVGVETTVPLKSGWQVCFFYIYARVDGVDLITSHPIMLYSNGNAYFKNIVKNVTNVWSHDDYYNQILIDLPETDTPLVRVTFKYDSISDSIKFKFYSRYTGRNYASRNLVGALFI